MFNSITAFRIGFPSCSAMDNIKNYNQCMLRNDYEDGEPSMTMPQRVNRDKNDYFDALDNNAEWLEINGRGWIWDTEIPASSSQNFKACIVKSKIKMISKKCPYSDGEAQIIYNGNIINDVLPVPALSNDAGCNPYKI